jgi:hypothetical protein
VVRFVARRQRPVQLLQDVVHHTPVRGVPDEEQLQQTHPYTCGCLNEGVISRTETVIINWMHLLCRLLLPLYL